MQLANGNAVVLCVDVFAFTAFCFLLTQIQRLSLDDFQKLITSGDMLLPSITTGFLALQHLRTQGLV